MAVGGSRAALVIVLGTACGRIDFGLGPRDGDARSSDDGSLVADARADAPMYVENVAFVSSARVSAAMLGGVAGGDAVCAEAARAAGWAGTFVAWLSTSSENAPARLGTSRGWVRPDGRPFADTATDVALGQTFYPLRIDELGMLHPLATPSSDDVVLTGTSSVGVSAATCNDYTDTEPNSATCGLPSAGASLWTSAAESFCTCTTLARIYCFEIGKQVAISVAPATAPRAFVSQNWLPGGGLGDADQKCQDLASAFSLVGTFQALLASSTASAASRFAASGPVWSRMDGVPLAASRDAFFLGALDVALDRDAGGALAGDATPWTGINGFFTPSDLGSLASTCLDWTDSTVGQNGGAGRVGYVGARFFGSGLGGSCSLARTLYCLEI